MKAVAVFVTLMCVSRAAGQGEASTLPPLPTTGPVKQCPTPEVDSLSPASPKLFYNCAEKSMKCGPESYLMGYGAKYATKFYEWAMPRMSEGGKAFIRNCLVCLQKELQKEISLATPCDDVWDIAIGTHAKCYADSGFCKLSVLDIHYVLRTIEAPEFFNPSFHAQVIETVKRCIPIRLGWN